MSCLPWSSDRYRQPLEPQIVDDPRRSLFFEPFCDCRRILVRDPATIADRRRARQFGRNRPRLSRISGIHGNGVRARRPRFDRGERVAEGRAFYRHRIRMFTTLDLTPEQVHQIGSAEVQRIRGEMQQILDQLNFPAASPNSPNRSGRTNDSSPRLRTN